jgi:hypothetical protein
MAATMRANPKEAAASPSCQSASDWVRPISGRSGPNAPNPKALQKSTTQRRRVRSSRKRPASPLT